MIKKSIIISIVLISIILSGCGVVPEIPEPNGVIYRGFFVGVGDYMFFSSVDLTAPPYNVRRLERHFGQCKFGEDEIEFAVIETLVDYNATKENILNGILSVFAESDDNDISYFYYMGHGGLKNGIPVITPTDTRFTLETSITVHELEEYLGKIPGIKVVFIESCHSGNFIDKGKMNFNKSVVNIFAKNSKNLLNKESYQVLTSSTSEQLTWTHSTWSYFCNGLLYGCQDLNADINGDEIVDLTELHNYIDEWVKAHLCSCKDQDVQMYPENSTFPIIEY